MPQNSTTAFARTGGSPELTRRTFLGGLSALSLAALAGCRSAVGEQAAAGGAATATRGGTLVATVAADPDPRAYFTGRPGNIFWNRNVLESLLLVDEKYEAHPVLATAWEFRDGNRTFVLTLRDGVTFHSGRPFTAADVVFALEREIAGDGLASLNNAMKGWEVTATGPREVTIRSPRPLQEIVFDILDTTPVIDRDTYKGLDDGSKVIGTGPFVWSGYEAGAQIRMARNNAYWEPGLPYLDGIELTVIRDSTAQLAALRSGRAQLANGLNVQDAMTVVDDRTFHLDTNHGLIYAACFDVTKPPFDNPEVRRAVGYAIDRDRINSQVFGGIGRITSLPWGEESTGYPADLAATYTYQPDRARQLLQSAGAAGASFTIALHNQPVPRSIYEILARNLADIGLAPTPVELAGPDFESRRASGQLGPAFLIWSASAGLAPALMIDALAELRTAGNPTNYVDPGYQQRAQALIDSPDENATAQRLRDLSQYMQDAAFMQPYAVVPATTVRADAARDIVISRNGRSMRSAFLVNGA
jgi:peptide/nickel transport system substrate-binding protein